MKCPYCLENFVEEPSTNILGKDADGGWAIIKSVCSGCEKIIVKLAQGEVSFHPTFGQSFHSEKEWLVKPKVPTRAPIPPEVPKEFTKDYKEACLVIADSPKASAALSRRCLQNILREVVKVKKGNLADEIQQVLDNKTFPSYISEPLDAVRNIGNFAAHPTKSLSTGEILQVEPGEAELNLDVIEALFDSLFVLPAKMKQKTAALNTKLVSAGKPPIKQP